ncbi:MAG: hypothetical protein LBI86_02290 [Treponema sp.]|jgi:hypothetical protein|nr:hypothetical protein [Treponema sp.]
MRVRILGLSGQALFFLSVLFACDSRTGQVSLEPPPAQSLSSGLVGYGVINASYTLLVARPETAGVSLGYLRRGSMVRIVERRSVNNGPAPESWVLVGGLDENPAEGWVREDVVDIYDNEYKAETASELMNR